MAGAAFAASDPAALDAAGQVINDKWEKLAGVRQRLIDAWESEIKPKWQGDSAEKYDAKVKQFVELLDRQLQALSELGELMGQSASNYRMQNADVDAAVNEIEAELA